MSEAQLSQEETSLSITQLTSCYFAQSETNRNKNFLKLMIFKKRKEEQIILPFNFLAEFKNSNLKI